MLIGEASLPPGLRVYAIGDIHGRADLLDQLHAKIEADLATAPAQCAIVYLGDYIDRGAESHGVIERLTRPRFPSTDATRVEVVTLLGNHEAMLLEFLDAPYGASLWLANGGDATLRSYKVKIPGSFDELLLTQRALLGVLPRHHKQFLLGLPLQVQFGDYLFVHAGIKPGLPLDRQSREQMIWIRDVFLDSEVDHGMIVVHGHTIVHEVEWRPNRIGVDTGAYTTGRLTALVLEGAGRRLLQT
ncbi:MAG: serine/threonine protein phosphatase [Ferrovibrio sp.]|uniref:metallophosphoesterase family protein n=1 Tax=Ferrovibrio sp. TaxID=1917215 RepID=UPI00261E50B6|nr:metallophosphoesterase family protein [Ferrovibrio sp.]MCW0235380.1 serine/threonine protein phosphatase [Ferrovibrio sp.]